MSDYFLADDLSGALDAAAAFHHSGRRVTIALSLDAWPKVAAGEIVGITTETRNRAPSIAAEEVARALAAGGARGARLVYKKIDSTMRGPVAAELGALTAAWPEARVLFTPANPRVGRTVRAGMLLVNGVPVSETEFSRDPVSPVRNSSLRALLGAAATLRVEIADAESEADLEAAVARMESAGGLWVGVGSGALVRAVAGRLPAVPVASAKSGDESPHSQTASPWLGGPAAVAPRFGVRRFIAAMAGVWRCKTESRAPASGVVRGPILFVGGSAHRANREQAAMLARECGVDVHEVRIDDYTPGVREASNSVRTRGSAALLLEEKRAESAVALRSIVTAATEVIAATGAARVFVTGGETAFALCRALGVSVLHFRAEIEAGLSLSNAATMHGPMLLAVKPGGFGDARTWVRAWTGLQGDA